MANPKPFIDLLGGHSLFQETVARMAKVTTGRPPVIITGRAYVSQVRRQLSEIGSDGRVIAEPEGRDSGPALLAAALWIAREDPDAVAVAVASDHHIPDAAAFAEAVHEVLAAARDGEIVTFGIRPTFPETTYGYIRPGAALSERSAVARVGQFVEKPDRARAEALVAEGCLWNSGNFVFGARSLLAEAKIHAPELLEAVTIAVDGAVDRDGVLELSPSFSRAPRLSIDNAIMEKTHRAAVLPISYAWTDLGSWDAVWASSQRDAAGNAVIGSAVVRDSDGCLVRVDQGARVVAIGLTNVAVVVKGCDVLVSERSRAGELKPALEALQKLPSAGPTPTSERALVEAAVRLDGWLREKALPTWWCFGADHEHGGFHDRLAQNLRPVGAGRRCLVQARQVHLFASAGLMGWPGPWRAAVDHGLDYLWSRFRRRDGLFRTTIGQAKPPGESAALLCDQASVLLALATAARALPAVAADLVAKGVTLASAIRGTFSYAGGGFIAREGDDAFLGGPLLHLFEAAQAWEQVDDDPFGEDLSEELAAHCLDRLYDPEGGRIQGRLRPAMAARARAGRSASEAGSPFQMGLVDGTMGRASRELAGAQGGPGALWLWRAGGGPHQRPGRRRPPRRFFDPEVHFAALAASREGKGRRPAGPKVVADVAICVAFACSGDHGGPS